MPRIQKLSHRPSLRTDGCYEVPDIEDLPRAGTQVKVSFNGFLSCKTMAPYVTDPVLLCVRTDMGKVQQGSAQVAVEWSRPSLLTAARRSSPLTPHLGRSARSLGVEHDFLESSRGLCFCRHLPSVQAATVRSVGLQLLLERASDSLCLLPMIICQISEQN
ncbi:uncharacterized protein [Triticum aestivum]|uniref:uncharacterized protein isoform X2 n=1 Tax=Triticum aestivum TaxID=4565 RepID=UPI001D00ACEA|nr:uncharacterized protein LOC123046142 isoform X2 [Triticum aestivum]XP_044325370.1 uncharacterized protein LOC123046142 isoform X2 [Triticum aestivum]